MKFLVLAACLSVSAAQGFFGLQGLPNGAVVPIDEPRVAAARADYLITKFGLGAGPVAQVAYGAAPFAQFAYGAAPLAQVAYGAAPLAQVAYGAAPVAQVAYAAGPAYPAYAPAYSYSGPLNLNTHLVAHPNGAVVPADEPAVAAARADHFAAQGAIYAASGPIIAPVAAPLAAVAPAFPIHSDVYAYSGPLNLNTHLVAHPNGAVVPADEPAVAAARADHFAAQGAIAAAHGPIIAPVAAPLAAVAPLAVAAPAFPIHSDVYAYSGPLNLNTHLVAHPNGAVVPADEPAVVAARADHLSTHGLLGGVYAHAAPVAYGAGFGYAPYGGLIAHPNGAIVPVDEPAVQAARADHLALLGATF